MVKHRKSRRMKQKAKYGKTPGTKPNPRVFSETGRRAKIRAALRKPKQKGAVLIDYNRMAAGLGEHVRVYALESQINLSGTSDVLLSFSREETREIFRSYRQDALDEYIETLVMGRGENAYGIWYIRAIEGFFKEGKHEPYIREIKRNQGT